MSIDEYPYLSENVNARIRAGEVPPPRGTSDAPDPIRDIKLALAVAQDKGDTAGAQRLNTELLGAVRNGAYTTWEPPPPPAKPEGRDVSQPQTRADWLRAAKSAEEAGLPELATSHRYRAMHAPQDADGLKLIDESAALDAAGEDPERSARLKIEALRALRGELPPPEPVPVPQGPQTSAEMREAIAQAEADGDLKAANGYRVGLLTLARQAAQGSTVDLDVE